MTRVLVADDDPWILRMVAAVLGQRGYEVDLARDGEEAYGKAVQNPPDLLITDVMMPKMDGWTLIKALRARPELAFLPVIFLTGMASEEDRIQGFRLGADDYMAKPFRFEELDLRVERTLGRSRMVEQVAREQIGAVDAPVPEPVDTEGSGPHIGLAGRLEQVGLSALLTLLEMERKTGILVIERESGRPGGTRRMGPTGRVFLARGKVMAARIDNQESPINADCIYHMLRWSAGSFEFNEVEVDMTDEIGTTTTHLLIEAARRIDEGDGS